MSEKKDEIGVIHGRFQPLHNGHMEDYVLPAAARCERLIVGIANSDPSLTAPHPANPVRAESGSNPFTYYERAMMIRSALVETGIQQSRFMIVPFPINRPELLKHYVPLDATFYVTIYDNWGRYKRELLKSLGLKVEVLFVRESSEKILSATRIRELIAGQGAWQSLVPPAVAESICRTHLDERIRHLLSEQSREKL
jgi:nicotinamide mononucleotide adenylyltransferase